MPQGPFWQFLDTIQHQPGLHHLADYVAHLLDNVRVGKQDREPELELFDSAKLRRRLEAQAHVSPRPSVTKRRLSVAECVRKHKAAKKKACLKNRRVNAALTAKRDSAIATG